MTVTLIIQIVLGALPFITAFAAFHLSTRSTRAQAETAAKAVDAQAYDRARGIYEAAINQLGENLRAAARRAETAEAELSQLRDCKDRLDQVEDALRQTRRDLAVGQREVAELREANRALAAQVRRLRGPS